EERMTPLDRRALRALARGSVGGSAGKKIEGGAPLELAELLRERRRRQESNAGGRQLDRQRQAVEPPADPGDRRGVALAQVELGARRPRAQDEERDGGRGRYAGDVQGRFGIGQIQG